MTKKTVHHSEMPASHSEGIVYSRRARGLGDDLKSGCSWFLFIIIIIGVIIIGKSALDMMGKEPSQKTSLQSDPGYFAGTPLPTITLTPTYDYGPEQTLTSLQTTDTYNDVLDRESLRKREETKAAVEAQITLIAAENSAKITQSIATQQAINTQDAQYQISTVIAADLLNTQIASTPTAAALQATQAIVKEEFLKKQNGIENEKRLSLAVSVVNSIIVPVMWALCWIGAIWALVSRGLHYLDIKVNTETIPPTAEESFIDSVETTLTQSTYAQHTGDTQATYDFIMFDGKRIDPQYVRDITAGYGIHNKLPAINSDDVNRVEYEPVIHLLEKYSLAEVSNAGTFLTVTRPDLLRAIEMIVKGKTPQYVWSMLNQTKGETNV